VKSGSSGENCAMLGADFLESPVSLNVIQGVRAQNVHVMGPGQLAALLL
jgi:hypothetical protein